jgi:hypothetical protein
LPIGAKIRFEAVTIERAQGLRRDLLAEIERINERIVPIGRSDADVAPKLSGHNLISGVVDARDWVI